MTLIEADSNASSERTYLVSTSLSGLRYHPKSAEFVLLDLGKVAIRPKTLV